MDLYLINELWNKQITKNNVMMILFSVLWYKNFYKTSVIPPEKQKLKQKYLVQDTVL